DAQMLPAAAGAGKSFFLADVLRKVAFGEANIAGTNRRVELQRAWLQKAAYVGAGGVAVALIAAWAVSYVRNHAYIGAVAADTEQAAALLAAVDSGDPDLLAALPALDAVRGLPGGYAARAAGGGWLGVGLSQADKLGDQAVASYRRVLQQLL